MADVLKLRLLFEATEKVTRPMKAVEDGASGMGRKLIDAKRAVAGLESQQKDIDGFRRTKRASLETSRALGEQQATVRRLAAEIEASDKPTREMRRNFERARKEADRLGRQHEQQERQLEDLRRSLGAADVSTTDLVGAQRRLKRQMGEANSEIEQQERKLGDLDRKKKALARGREDYDRRRGMAGDVAGAGAGAVAGGLSLALPVGLATREAMGLQGRMIDVRKVIEGIDDAGIERLRSGLIEMAGRIPVPLDGLGQIAAEGARAGVAADDLLPYVENSAKMAAAFDITADAAGQMTSQWRKGLGLTLPQTVELGDQINALTNKFGGAAPAIGEMVGEIGPLGGLAGVVGGEIAAMSQLMNAMGIDAQKGSTGVKNFLLTLSAGEAVSRQQAAAFRNVGLSATEVASRNQGIKSVTGHSGDSEVALYTREVEQEALARETMRRLVEWELSNRIPNNVQPETKVRND